MFAWRTAPSPSPFKAGRSSSASGSFHASLHWGDWWRDVLCFSCAHVQCLKLLNASDDLPRRKPQVVAALTPASLYTYIYSIIFLHSGMYRVVYISTRVFEDGCRIFSDTCSLDFHFSLFVASSMNLWGWWHMRSDCNLSTVLWQSSGGHMGVCFQFHPHCQAAGWDRTVFMNSGREPVWPSGRNLKR